MTFEDFERSITATSPPGEISAALTALWHDARGDWKAAHAVAQDIDNAAGAWVHAYLHRKEGDVGNAAYWYRQAGRSVATGDLNQEWGQIVRALLEAAPASGYR